eukprot:gene4543-5564_t
MTTFNVADFPPRSTQELVAADFGMSVDELSMGESSLPPAALQAAFLDGDGGHPTFQAHTPKLSLEPALQSTYDLQQSLL